MYIVPTTETLKTLLIPAIQQRLAENLPDAQRLFNGFYEGLPGMVMDRYGPTLVIFNHAEPGEHHAIIQAVSRWALDQLPGITAVLLKERQSADERLKNGVLIAGQSLATTIQEMSVQYALDLQMNQDAGFYLDTRNLRRWLLDNMSGRRVLNTFAYTGSLGVAAGVGGASQVFQTDLNPAVLKIAERSWLLNALPKPLHQHQAGDFFRIVGRLRHQGRLFDCVILDPPYFSVTEAGRVDLQEGTTRLVNKVRPLVGHEGWLVVINNALYHPGSDFMAEIMKLCQSKYLQMESMIPIPPDITGYPNTVVDSPPADPSPFNHPTKIVILKAFRKDQRRPAD